MENKRQCCRNTNCTCPPNNCTCINCKCGNKQCPGCQKNVETLQYSKQQKYSNVGGKQDYEGEQVVRHRINENEQEEVTREKMLPGGKTLVTKEILKGGELKNVDQYVKQPENQPSIQ